MFRYKSRITPFFNTKNHKNIRRINLKNKNTGKNNNPGKLKNIRGKIKIPGIFPLRKAPDIVSFFQFYFRLSAFYRFR